MGYLDTGVQVEICGHYAGLIGYLHIAGQIGYPDTLLDGEDIVTLLEREVMWALYWTDGVSGHWCASGDMRTLCGTGRISAHCWTNRISGHYAGLMGYLHIAGQIGYPDTMLD